MQLLELFGAKSEMKYIMLTVFKENNRAMDFYIKKLNYVIDETSPSNIENKEEEIVREPRRQKKKEEDN